MFSKLGIFLRQHFEIRPSISVPIPWMHKLVKSHLYCNRTIKTVVLQRKEINSFDFHMQILIKPCSN